jgi:hypothetical protein
MQSGPRDPEILWVALDRPLARRILTSIEILSQKSTSLQPEFETLREAIKTAFADAILAPEQEQEPLEREIL